MSKGNPAWKPGVSGNPKGRPPVGLSLAAALRQRLPIEQLVEVAAELLADADAKIRLETLKLVFDRAHGKVLTTVEITEKQPEAAINWSAVPVDKRQALLAALEEVEAIAETADADEIIEH